MIHLLQVDEIRREEDYEPLGFNYIQLGLGDVLLNPQTTEVFSPNTGQTTALGEVRARNYKRDSLGRFAGNGGGGGSGGSSGGKSPEKVDKSGENGIINKKSCTVHPDKAQNFFLKPGAKHSKEFFDVGYTEKDSSKLIKDLNECFDYSKAVDKSVSKNGVEKFSIFTDLGVSKKKRFRTVWQKDTPESTPRIITAHRESHGEMSIGKKEKN